MDIYEKFGKYDQDLDGMISVEEAHTILYEELGFDKERSRAMVNRFDVNKDGVVSYVEFAEFYMAVEDRLD
jgi:Ca2+-binding EF-hand superfamily protein